MSGPGAGARGPGKPEPDTERLGRDRAGGGPPPRDRILERIREALRTRARTEHPGPFGGEAPDSPELARFGGNVHAIPAEVSASVPYDAHALGAPAGPSAEAAPAGSGDVLTTFRSMFAAAGGEVVHVPDQRAAADWLMGLAEKLGSVTWGRTVPEALRRPLPQSPPETAALGVSMARGAVAETGSLLMDARDGRRTQLLPPVHVVLVAVNAVHPTLRSALRSLRDDLPSAVGLHSGPSKSADLGQVLVTGVHGPGRVIALVVG